MTSDITIIRVPVHVLTHISISPYGQALIHKIYLAVLRTLMWRKEKYRLRRNPWIQPYYRFAWSLAVLQVRYSDAVNKELKSYCHFKQLNWRIWPHRKNSWFKNSIMKKSNLWRAMTLRSSNLFLKSISKRYTILQNKRMRRCGVAPPIIFERLKLPQQIIYCRKENLSQSPNHQKYWENTFVSRFYEQFSRNRRNLGHFRKFEKISNS